MFFILVDFEDTNDNKGFNAPKAKKKTKTRKTKAKKQTMSSENGNGDSDYGNNSGSIIHFISELLSIYKWYKKKTNKLLWVLICYKIYKILRLKIFTDTEQYTIKIIDCQNMIFFIGLCLL